MDDGPALALTHTFAFREKRATYTVSFYTDLLHIEADGEEPTRIRYADVHKIRSKGQTLKIYLKDGTTVEMPCTIGEIKCVQRIFRRSLRFEPSAVRTLAFVEFGELCFFIKIGSNDFSAFKATVIKRIAKYFYPAFDDDGISLGLFRKFVLRIRKGARLVTIDNSEDLDSALTYFDYRVDIVIEYAND
ncbi:hypothetical protein PAPHI01_0143 [Pancytospora philotis]|nr:hypothetical protein PAPHI01_0143 [Pancytospora philotis]